MSVLGDKPFLPPEDLRRLSPVALKAVRRIGSLWLMEPSDIALMLGMLEADYAKALDAQEKGCLTDSQMFRAGIIIGIYGALSSIFGADAAARWPNRPNKAPGFDGRSAIGLMLADGLDAMIFVFRYLQALRMGL